MSHPVRGRRGYAVRIATAVALAGLFLGGSPPAGAFSVLAHQAVVDRCWDDTIVPALRARFPDASAEDVARARAFAHGGSHVADLGYYPLGRRLFTDLAHYVRSGDFVSAMVDDARTLDEYAFALGALSHHVTDSIGHPEATNRTVPDIYPKLRKKYGDVVTYADDHTAHLETEFRFDVLEAADSPRDLDLLKHAVEFEVAKPVLGRAFQRTYGLSLGDVFTDEDVAITTYRWAFRGVIHEATGIAWQLYRADLHAIDPSMTPAAFVWDLSRGDFEKEYGAVREPGGFTRFFAFLAKIVPNVGPLKRLPYEPLPGDVRARFEATMARIVDRYRAVVVDARDRRRALRDVNLDTGHPARHGDYEPADETYARLVHELDERGDADVPPALRTDILRFYATDRTAGAESGDDADDARIPERSSRVSRRASLR
jgi:hypothetical protein